MSLRVRTEPVEDERELLDLLRTLPDEERSAFVRSGEGLVTAGTAHRVAVPRGPGRFRSARAELDALASAADVDDPVDLPGTGLIAIGSFAFDEASDDTVTSTTSVLRVPRVILGRRAGTTWRTTIEGPRASGPSGTAQAAGGRDHAASGPSDRPRFAGSSLDDVAWLEAVDQTLDVIRSGRALKVVLARDVRLWSRTDFDIHEVLDGLARRFPSCFTFLVDGLVGASPELLLRRRGRYVASRVLAGTARRGPDPEEDARLGEGLMASRKDRWEHDLAARSVSEVLGPLCDRIDIPDAPSLVRLENVQHLGSDLSGTLAGPTHILDILESLHPTAAVAGTPRGAALALIRELEGMDRGRYAGPVGWCDASGDGEFAIALRCAHIEGGRARLFAGAGVVEGSLPESELMETWLKLRAMTEALTRR